MLKHAVALLAAFAAVGQASLQAGALEGKDHGKGKDHEKFHAIKNIKDLHPQAKALANSSYVMPSLSASGTGPSSPPIGGTGSSSPPIGGTAPTSAPGVVTSPPPSAGASSSASAGFPSYTNSTTPSVTLGPSVITKTLTKTVTTCPVTVTHGEGENASTETYFTTSTEFITSTITVCTKCVEVPQTTSPPQGNGSPTEGSPEGSPENGPEGQGESLTLTYTVGTGEQQSVVTTTVKNTHTATRTHFVYASESPGSGEGSPESSSPANSGEQCQEGESCITETSKIYRTSTLYITRPSTCPEQKTITVPGPDVTVTVTAMQGPPSGVPGGPLSSAPYGNSTLPGTGVSSSAGPSSGFITKVSNINVIPVPSGQGHT